MRATGGVGGRVYTRAMSSSQLLRVVVLGSGSAGNAVAITDGATTLLVDCGFSAREAAKRLASVGLDADSVTALVVTHEHHDHVRGVEVFSRRHSVPVFATRGTARAADLARCVSHLERLVLGEAARIGTLSLLPFATSHDAAEPMGVRVDADSGASFGLATDTGVLTPQAAEALADVDVLGIESNHDLGMLEHGPYPPFLKRRIRSDQGHLSNACAADALERLASNRLRRILALHRSQTNNTPELAGHSLRTRAGELGLGATVDVACQNTVLDTHPPQGSLFAEGAE
jgi:phosphoribosyl 1,2-cyclic phosphodiesterase